MAQTHLQRRNSCFYYRQKIPADLLVHFGKGEIIRSLRTGKRREASAAAYEQGHNWVLSDHNYAAGRDVPGYSKLCVRFLEILIRARKIVVDRNAGRPPNTEGIAPLALTFKANADSHGLTIAGLHAIWAARQTGTPKTTDEFLSIIRRFEAFVVGQFRTDQAANVKQVYVIAYRNYLTKEGFKPATVTKKLSTIKTLFNTAIEDGMLSPSEVQSVKVGKPKKTRREKVQM